jgi:hypothetical protein
MLALAPVRWCSEALCEGEPENARAGEVHYRLGHHRQLDNRAALIRLDVRRSGFSA